MEPKKVKIKINCTQMYSNLDSDQVNSTTSLQTEYSWTCRHQHTDVVVDCNVWECAEAIVSRPGSHGCCIDRLWLELTYSHRRHRAGANTRPPINVRRCNVCCVVHGVSKDLCGAESCRSIPGYLHLGRRQTLNTNVARSQYHVYSKQHKRIQTTSWPVLTTPLSFEAPSPRNPHEYLHECYTAWN